MKKILVIGCSGVGKSTIAKRISDKTGLPYTPTDPFYWEPNWKHAKTQSVVERVGFVTQQDAWILDGNFDSERDFVWPLADIIIWLDYPLQQVALQILKRNLGLWFSQKPTWSGNRMNWKRAWSGIRHSIKSHKSKRRNYPKHLNSFPHLRFCSPNETAKWLVSLNC